MLSDTKSSVPIIFLITDGAVEDERRICDVMKHRLMDKRKMFPRIYTFGIGMFIFDYLLITCSLSALIQYQGEKHLLFLILTAQFLLP